MSTSPQLGWEKLEWGLNFLDKDEPQGEGGKGGGYSKRSLKEEKQNGSQRSARSIPYRYPRN